MDVTLCFDTEDYTSPPEAGLDDIPKWLAETLSEEGVRGSFQVIGSKARSLRQRGRADVIAALSKHEIGVHTQFGSEHPTLVEALAPLDWDDGVRLCLDREGAACRELREIFGVEPGNFSSHGSSQAAPMHYVCGSRFNKPWLYSYVPCPPEGFCWYASCFQLRWRGLAMSEAAYSQPDRVEATLARWDTEIEANENAGVRWSYVFLAHPLMIRCKQFNDALNFPDGHNRIPWRTPELRTPEEMRVAREQFRRVVRHLAAHPKLRIRTLQDVFQQYGQRKPHIRREELELYARRAEEDQSIPTGWTFSAGEALLAFADAVGRGGPEDRTPIREVLGPTAEPPRAPDNPLAWLEGEALKGLAQALLEEVRRSGRLPFALPVPNGSGRMGLPTVFLCLASAWRQLAARETPRVRVPHICNRYPVGAMAVEARARESWLNWPIHDLHLPVENLSRQVRLQCWTWKRAWDGSDEIRAYDPIA
jgi:hypothetical protein